MKCPIKIPVKVIGSNGTIVDIENVMVVKVLFRYPDRFELQMQQLRYAAKAINSHEKLLEYAQHKQDCNLLSSIPCVNYNGKEVGCDCGLEKALEGEKSE